MLCPDPSLVFQIETAIKHIQYTIIHNSKYTADKYLYCTVKNVKKDDKTDSLDRCSLSTIICIFQGLFNKCTMLSAVV